MKTPVLMEKLGLNNIGVRINDYVDFVGVSSDDFETDKRRFIKDHGLDAEYAESNGFFAARCHVISFGYK